MPTQADPTLCQQIVEQIPDAIVFADRDGVIRSWSPGAEALTGYRAEEAVGNTLDIVIPKSCRAQHWQGYHRAMAAGGTRANTQSVAWLTSPLMHRDGTAMQVEASFALLRDSSGALLGVATIIRRRPDG
jgi:PAS domain S-box-containing protein